MNDAGPPWLLQQQEEIINWVVEHPRASLPDCASYFAVSEEALRELVERKQFRNAFERQLEAEWRALTESRTLQVSWPLR